MAGNVWQWTAEPDGGHSRPAHARRQQDQLRLRPAGLDAQRRPARLLQPQRGLPLRPRCRSSDAAPYNMDTGTAKGHGRKDAMVKHAEQAARLLDADQEPADRAAAGDRAGRLMQRPLPGDHMADAPGGRCGSLFLAISGSTVLNMVYDRDIDALMKRTCWRPLPVHTVSLREAHWRSGWAWPGWAWAGPPSCLRSMAWWCLPGCSSTWPSTHYCSSGAPPTPSSSAGSPAACPFWPGGCWRTGQVDGIGVLLALAVFLWIPTHIMTFSIRYADDYARAGIPTFPSTYGVPLTTRPGQPVQHRRGVSVMAAAVLIGMDWGYLASWLGGLCACWGWLSPTWCDHRPSSISACSSTHPCTCCAQCCWWWPGESDTQRLAE